MVQHHIQLAEPLDQPRGPGPAEVDQLDLGREALAQVGVEHARVEEAHAPGRQGRAHAGRRRGRDSPVAEQVEVERVAGHDRVDVGLGQAVRGEELVDHAGELGVGMGVVGRPEQAVGADVVDQALQAGLVGLEADPALAAEVLAGQHRQVLRLDVADPLHVLVEAGEPVRQPGPAGLEDRHLQARMTLHHPADGEAGDRTHLLHGVAHGVVDDVLLEAVVAVLGHEDPAALVGGDRGTELGQRGVEAVVGAVVEVAAVVGVRPDHHAGHAQLGDGVARLDRGQLRVLQADQADAHEPLGCVVAEVAQPPVVGPADGRRDAPVEVGDRRGVEAP